MGPCVFFHPTANAETLLLRFRVASLNCTGSFPTVGETINAALEAYLPGQIAEQNARMNAKINPVTILNDGLCACSCADVCPLRKTGGANRCTAGELESAGIAVRHGTKEQKN